MKTAEEMRAISNEKRTSEELVKRALVYMEHEAKSGAVSVDMALRRNHYDLKDIDWAMTELVALGFNCKLKENFTENFHQLIINW